MAFKNILSFVVFIAGLREPFRLDLFQNSPNHVDWNIDQSCKPGVYKDMSMAAFSEAPRSSMYHGHWPNSV